MEKPELSVIILNYNTKDLTFKCIESIRKHTHGVNYEIIVVDNGSTDGSVEVIKKHEKIILIKNDKNLGFAAGNNSARKIVKGKYILFLNSDILLTENTFKSVLDYFKKHKDTGALTCKLVMPSGKLDKDARRSFPTPWIAFTHFARLDLLLPKSRIFSKYWYGYISPDTTHEIDVVQGSFFLSSKKILDKVDWFDEDYFLNGEDIDLSWKIKNLGLKNIYYPKTSVIHIKGATKGKKQARMKKPPLKERIKFTLMGINAMEIFYNKRLKKSYSPITNATVFAGIKILKVIRVIKIFLA